MSTSEVTPAVTAPRSVGERLWRGLRWPLLLLTIGVQLVYNYQYGTERFGFFNPDKTCQVSGAQSLMDGHKISVPSWNPARPQVVYYEPILGWPPGYSLLVAAGLCFTSDLWRIAFALDVIAAVGFFGAWFVILELLGRQLNVLTKLLLWASWLLVASPLVIMTNSETLAVAAFSWTLLLLLLALRGRHPYALAATAGAFLAAAAALRYAYWPLVLAPSFGLAVAAWKSPRWKARLAAAAVCLAVALVLLGGLALFQKTQAGYVTYLSARYTPQVQGWYWRHLRYPHAFPATAVGVTNIWNWFRWNYTWPQQISSFRLLWGASFAVLTLIAAVLGRRWWQARKSPPQDSETAGAWFLFASGWATTLLTVAMLSWLSLRNPPEPAPGLPQNLWTFVFENRYFAVFFPFLLLAWTATLAALLGAGSRMPKVLRVGLFLLVLAGLFMGGKIRYESCRGYVTDSNGSRTFRNQLKHDIRCITATVREHAQSKRPVLFLDAPTAIPEYGQYYAAAALMAGACQVKLTQALTIADPALGACTLLVVAPGAANSLQAAQAAEMLRKRPNFVAVGPLGQGTLYAAPPTTFPR